MMRISESAENYLESILILKNRNGFVRAVDIANMLEFTKPSVSVAMKNLKGNGFIIVDSDNNIELTDKGMEIAEKMYERHLLITKVLMSMGVEEEVASIDACKIEHVVSNETIDGMRRYIKKKENWFKTIDKGIGLKYN